MNGKHMKQFILAFLFCLVFSYPALAAEQPTILLGLKWGDSEEIVHKKMQELNLIHHRRRTPEAKWGLPIDVSMSYIGKILDVEGYLSADFQNDNLASVFVGYYSVPYSLFNNLVSALQEKYGNPKESFDMDDNQLDDHITWQIKNIDTRIIIEVFEDDVEADVILRYERLSWINEHLAGKKKQQEEQVEKLKKQL